jgi:Tfp pilus assembly protein PilN
MRTIQKKLDNYTQVEPTAELVDIFPELQKITPPGIELSQLIIKSGTISFTGTTNSQPSLNTLINNLELSAAFTDVQVNKIESSQEEQGRLLFVIQAVPTVGGGPQTQQQKKPATNPQQPAS